MDGAPAPAPHLSTRGEQYNDIALSFAFLCTCLVSLKRMHFSYSLGGVETKVVTAFYSLILVTSFSRFLWFVVPSDVMENSYNPIGAKPVMAFSSSPWLGTLVSEILVSCGSLSLLSIFILILVYWHDILLKYFYPGLKRNKPISTFLTITAALFLLQGTNIALFLLKFYSNDMMILSDSLLLGLVSVICVAEISIFSHRFRTVLRTLGAINQVSTESQVKRIVWITVTGNVFFLVRAALEVYLSFALSVSYKKTGSFRSSMSDGQWDCYILVKHWCEVCILCLMLYILQSRFEGKASSRAAKPKDRKGYAKIPEAETGNQRNNNGSDMKV